MTALLWARSIVGSMLLVLVVLYVWSASKAEEPGNEK